MKPERVQTTMKAWHYVVLLCILAFIVRLIVIQQSDFPLNQGGMFYGMVEDIIANHFVLPFHISYNHDHIPFAYSPIPFYVAASLTHFLGIPLLELFRYLPMLISLVTIPLIYLLGTELLASSSAALIGLYIFILSGGSFQALIEGGGLTRSFGVVFALSSIYTALKYYKTKKNSYLPLVSIFLALSLLSHIETSAFTVYTIALLYVVYDRSFIGFFKSLGMGIGALLIASPWLYIILNRYGFTPFIAALHSNPWNLGLQELSLLNFVANPAVQVLPLLFILGFLVCIVKRNLFIPLWLLLLMATASRMVISTITTIPLSLLAGAAMIWVILPGLKKLLESARPSYRRSIYAISLAVLALACIFSLWTAYWHTLTPFNALSRENRVAMAWVRSHTEPSAQFIVMSPVPYWGWFLDKDLEWFPVLTGRRSVSTVQGSEWLPGEFMRRLDMTRDIKACNNERIECLHKATAKHTIGYQYIYISKSIETDFDMTPCCSQLVNSLAASKAYELIYDDAGASIWKKK